MTKDSNSKGPAGGFTIDLPEGVKKSLPRDFDISDIGTIDLREAEAIANENVLLLNENDLIEGLEDFDLIPLRESAKPAEERPLRAAAPREPAEPATRAAVAELPAETLREEPVRAEAAPVEPADRSREEVPDDGRVWVSLHDLETIDDEGRTWVPLDRLDAGETRSAAATAADAVAPPLPPAAEERGERVEGARPAGTEGPPALTLDDLLDEKGRDTVKPGPAAPVSGEELEPVREERPGPAFMAKAVAAAQEEPAAAEGHVDENEEYMIWEMPDSDAVIAEPVPRPEVHETPAAPREKPACVTEEPVRKPPVETAPPDKPVKLEHEKAKDVPLAALKKIEAPFRDEAPPPVAGESAPAQPLFIDERKAPERVDEGAAEETRLEKLIGGIVQVDEGASYLLREADAGEDRERIAPISEEFRPEDEVLSEDLDYKYGDEEMDFVHTAIVEEDYSSYIREIDEFFGAKGGRTVSARLELLGLTADEFDTIEDLLFKKEHGDARLYDRYSLYEFNRDARGGAKEDRRYRYLLPAEGSLIDIERDSIENDVSGSSALIFEEDVEQIREKLKKRTGRTDAEVVALVERVFEERAEAAEEEPREEAPAPEGPVAVPLAADLREPVPGPQPAPVDTVFDITDRVVILEDQADVERFVRTFPEPKQVNVKMLLKYLDGLFEKLPEEIIRKFASSDYFNLYLKVLNELGV